MIGGTRQHEGALGDGLGEAEVAREPLPVA